jgi:hypothetical protein
MPFRDLVMLFFETPRSLPTGSFSRAAQMNPVWLREFILRFTLERNRI